MKGLLILTVVVLLSACAGIRPRFHVIREGETLVKIASQYAVSTHELENYNRDEQKNGLKPGRKLFIPYETRADWDEGFDTEKVAYTVEKAPKVEKASIERVVFSWPVSGMISSYFGKRKHKNHDGIDIVARHGTQVKAARSGHVIYAGNEIAGYGNLVIVRHPDAYSSVYAHLSKIEVRKGQFVTRGQKVGRVGRTGHATNDHLHFEIRKDRSPENPLFYLQGRYAHNILSRRTF